MLIIQLCEAREDYVAQQLEKPVLTAFKRDNGVKPHGMQSALSIVKHIGTADRKSVQWLTNQYVKGAFKLEDLSRIKTYIIKFNGIKQKLPQNQRDLNRYPTLPDLYNVVKQHDQQLASQTQQKKSEYDATSAKFIKDKRAEVVYNKNGISVIIPHDQAASCHFGADTEWCTAHKDEEYNYYHQYEKSGYLYIIKTKTGKMYQAHVTTTDSDEYDTSDIGEEDQLSGQYGDIELKDVDDVDINVKALAKKHPALKDALHAIHDHAGTGTFYPNFDTMSSSERVALIAKHPTTLEAIPVKYQTKRMIHALLGATDNTQLFNLSSVAAKFHMMPEVIQRAVATGTTHLLTPAARKKLSSTDKAQVRSKAKRGGWDAVEFAETEDHYIELINKNFNLMRDIPKEAQTEKMVDAFLDKASNWGNESSWEAVDDKFKTPERIHKVVTKMPKLLATIPHNKQTRQLLLDIIDESRDGQAVLEFGNPDLIDEDIKIPAITADPMIMVKEFKDKDLHEHENESFLLKLAAKGVGLQWMYYQRKRHEVPKSVIYAVLKTTPDEIAEVIAPTEDMFRIAAEGMDRDSALHYFGRPMYMGPHKWTLDLDAKEKEQVTQSFNNIQQSLPWAKEALDKFNTKYK